MGMTEVLLQTHLKRLQLPYFTEQHTVLMAYLKSTALISPTLYTCAIFQCDNFYRTTFTHTHRRHHGSTTQHGFLRFFLCGFFVVILIVRLGWILVLYFLLGFLFQLV